MMKTLLLLALSLSAQALSLGNSLDSCEGRCGYGTDSSSSCQCNPACERFGDCCADYQSVCTGDSSALPITNAELLSVAELLFALDENKASPALLVISPQALVSSSQTGTQQDLSPGPLFSFVDEASLFSRPTFSALLALLDNYHRQTGLAENFSPAQLAEQEHFLMEAISNTQLGQELYSFLYSKKLYSSMEEFLQDLKMMWFGLYSRGKNQLDSSGFEHIFADGLSVCLSQGEIKKGKVSGFHNWVQFYRLEKEGLLNYYSHSFDGPWTGYPDVLGMQFNWDGYFKEVGSALIGSSPEFDLALYTLCYIARPGKHVRVSVCQAVSVSVCARVCVHQCACQCVLGWCVCTSVRVSVCQAVSVSVCARVCVHQCACQCVLGWCVCTSVRVSVCQAVSVSVCARVCVHQCRLSLGGKPLVIQTYTWDNSFYGNGKKFIASAYPASP
ncbi:ENDOU endoribonuclease, partial [Atractosteus spatula]|nr:ENDOU endoribonuclease [Atractosteus spatula]